MAQTAELKQRQHDEAVKRLEKLVSMGLMPTVLDEFKRDGRLYYSERSPLGGILYWVDNEELFVNEIKRFEEKNDAIVYHAMLTRTEFGTIFDMFHVAKYEFEWEDDMEKLECGMSCNYALNLWMPDFSEFGWETFGIQAGGLVRLS